MRLSSHRLNGPEVTHLYSPNVGSHFAENLPDTIVMHYTACDEVGEAVQILCDPTREASAHLVISNEAEIFQLISFDTIAWHAGKSNWNGRESLNQYSIGIEVDNAGKLEVSGDRYFSWSGKEYAQDEVWLSESGEAWHKYSEAQLAKLDVVVALLLENYQINSILAHSNIAPDRKTDPGPAFPMDRYQQLL